jgi:hypothetical protein
LNQPIELTAGGRPRCFALHLPRTGSGGGIPLVIVLHGNHPDANGQMMRDWTTFVTPILVGARGGRARRDQGGGARE